MAEIESLLVVGDGGREAEMLRKALEEGVSEVFSTRGKDAVNYGLEGVMNTGLGSNDIDGITSWARQEKIDLVAVGPEAPLIAGLADALRASGVAVFGPGADGAMFEADKTFTHDFAERHGLGNPHNSETFTPDQAEEAKDHVRQVGATRIFTKRVGQEGGKGAKSWDDEEGAFREIDEVMAKGEPLLIQGKLEGPEYSGIFMLDGKGGVVATSLSRDHKALRDGGQGPNTGGMGAVAPLSFEQASWSHRAQIYDIGMAAVEGLLKDGIDYRGALYLGLMAENMTPEAKLRLLEINVRFGDPETQVILPLLGRHAVGMMADAAHGSIDRNVEQLYLSPDAGKAVATVCLASPGYAENGAGVVTGLPIHLPKDLPDDVFVHFAGAKMVDGVPTSSSGRVLYVTKRGKNLDDALKVYDYIGRENGGVYIGDDQQVMRTDIGRV